MAEFVVTFYGQIESSYAVDAESFEEAKEKTADLWQNDGGRAKVNFTQREVNGEIVDTTARFYAKGTENLNVSDR